MKNILLILVMTIFGIIHTSAQIKGNGQLVIEDFPVKDLKQIEVSLYADLVVDMGLDEMIQIETEENLLPLIDLEVVEGRLVLDQKEWIQPSRRIKIRIGAPHLKKVIQNTNDVVMLTNVNADELNLMALSGEIMVSGKATTVYAGSENGKIELRETVLDSLYLNVWGPGIVSFQTAKYLKAKLSDEAQLRFEERPVTVKGNISRNIESDPDPGIITPEYISFKIRNNSANREDFFVVGPKPDGRNFSYGFPMMPGATRKEKWTTGTRVYKVGFLGSRKLVLTIKKEDEDQTVDLFE